MTTPMSDRTPPPTGPMSSRRQFLLAGSAAMAGAVLLRGDLLSAPSGLQLMADGTGPRVPVAYVEGSAGAASLAAALSGSRRAVPAAGMRATRPLATGDSRVTVLGFADAAHGQRESSLARVLLDAHVPSPARHDETLPIYAFTFRRDPAVSVSVPTRLHVPAGRSLRMGFRVEAAQGAADAASSAATTVFTSSARRGLPTLQAGVYLLGLQQGMWSSATTLPAAGDRAWAELPSLVLLVEEAAAL